MTEKEKRESCAAWEAFSERCAEKPADTKPKSKPKKKGKA